MDNFSVNQKLVYISNNSGDFFQPKENFYLRVALVAISFICLYEPAGKLYTAGEYALTSVNSFHDLCMSDNLGEFGIAACKTGLAAAAVLFILTSQPIGMVVASIGLMVFDLKKLIIEENDKVTTLDLILSLVSSACYIAMGLSTLPEVTVIALIGLAFVELNYSYQEFQNDRTLEGYAHLILAFIQGIQTVPHANRVYENRVSSKAETKNDYGSSFIKQLTDPTNQRGYEEIRIHVNEKNKN